MLRAGLFLAPVETAVRGIWNAGYRLAVPVG